jgi:hypothetical protein
VSDCPSSCPLLLTRSSALWHDRIYTQNRKCHTVLRIGARFRSRFSQALWQNYENKSHKIEKVVPIWHVLCIFDCHIGSVLSGDR